MSRNQELDYVTDIVCTTFGVDRSELLSKSKQEDAVDARTMLCHILAYQGVSAKKIAEWVGISSRSVNSHLSRYYARLEQDVWFSNLVEWARQRTRETCPYSIRVDAEVIRKIPRTN